MWVDLQVTMPVKNVAGRMCSHRGRVEGESVGPCMETGKKENPAAKLPKKRSGLVKWLAELNTAVRGQSKNHNQIIALPD